MRLLPAPPKPVEPAPSREPAQGGAGAGRHGGGGGGRGAAVRGGAAEQGRLRDGRPERAHVAFLDTASSTVGSGPDEVQTHYAGIFKTPGDLAFTNLRYAFGRGWAAVIWTAASQSFGASGDGVTMLEIRDGKIARETLYYNSAKVPF